MFKVSARPSLSLLKPSVGRNCAANEFESFLFVPVENENHCDFVKLREMLICVNMEDLREQTHTRHYELYRRCKLEEMGFKDTGPECKPVR